MADGLITGAATSLQDGIGGAATIDGEGVTGHACAGSISDAIDETRHQFSNLLANTNNS